MSHRSETVHRAVAHLSLGHTLAFPTETVWGLGADAHNTAAIEGIYTLKGRDASKVMSLHIADAEMARRYTLAWPDIATELTERFWPGPLTIILAANTAGLSPRAIAPDHTVGLRCPDHPITHDIIASFGRAIVGTSANKSSQPPCLSADEVRAVFPGAESGAGLLIVDDNRAPLAKASTVVSLVDPHRPRILRQGAIASSELGL